MEPKQCDWCSTAAAKIWADIRVRVYDLDGHLLSVVALCSDCGRRGVAVDNGTLYPKD